MKYILAIHNTLSDVFVEYFDTKEALLAFFNDNNWHLIDTVDWNHLEKYTNVEARYVADKQDRTWYQLRAYLRVIK
jgi:hypothetical protein